MDNVCGSPGGCACAGATVAPTTAPPVACINGVALHAAGQRPDDADLRQRAWTELLRQRAQAEGLLDAGDAAPADGVYSLNASQAIEALLALDVPLPQPDAAACRRYFDAHRARFAQGERVQARHILFAVTRGVDVNALRQRAEAVLIEVRADAVRFAAQAAALSNCPTGAAGGALGWLGAEDCAPEFAREVFGQPEVGVLPRLVHSRFGLHVVEVLAREPGTVPEFEAVHGAVASSLQHQAWNTALRQYLQRLAAEAAVEGIALDAATSPLVQ